MKITTAYRNVNGTPKVTARASGKQVTVNWDLSKSTDWNHGTAAGALVLAKGDVLPPHSLDHNSWTHDSNDAGTIHRFDI